MAYWAAAAASSAGSPVPSSFYADPSWYMGMGMGGWTSPCSAASAAVATGAGTQNLTGAGNSPVLSAAVAANSIASYHQQQQNGYDNGINV